jgi:Predicted membrane protein (DUF2079)
MTRPETVVRGLVHSTGVSDDNLRFFRNVAISLFGLQLIGLLAYSAFIYHRFTLGIDFAVYSQGVSQIARGHLNPYLTIFGYPLIKSHFELILWPIGFLLFIVRSPYLLLVIQDLALVGTGTIAFLWIYALVVSSTLTPRVRRLSLAAVCVVILINPLTYFTAALDFHMEALATFFAIFGAYDIWSGRHRRALIWLGLCLLCGDVASLYVVGVGISALLSSSARRLGLLLVAVGVGWIGLIGALGANLGSVVSVQLAYLAGRHVLPTGIGGGLAIIGGVIAHPSRPYDVLKGRLSPMFDYLLPGGVIGFVTVWGFGVPMVVLLSSGLQNTPIFINEPYQQFAVFPFVLFGTVSLLVALATRPERPPDPGDNATERASARPIAAVVLAIAALAGAFYYAASRLPDSFHNNAVNGFIPGNEATALRTVLRQTSADTEVIASLPISGRFGARKDIYLYLSATAPIPIKARTVLLVMDTAHTTQIVPPDREAEAARYVTTRFHARQPVKSPDLLVLEWTAPSSMNSVTLP